MGVLFLLGFIMGTPLMDVFFFHFSITGHFFVVDYSVENFLLVFFFLFRLHIARLLLICVRSCETEVDLTRQKCLTLHFYMHNATYNHAVSSAFHSLNIYPVLSIKRIYNVRCSYSRSIFGSCDTNY